MDSSTSPCLKHLVDACPFPTSHKEGQHFDHNKELKLKWKQEYASKPCPNKNCDKIGCVFMHKQTIIESVNLPKGVIESLTKRKNSDPTLVNQKGFALFFVLNDSIQTDNICDMRQQDERDIPDLLKVANSMVREGCVSHLWIATDKSVDENVIYKQLENLGRSDIKVCRMRNLTWYGI